VRMSKNLERRQPSPGGTGIGERGGASGALVSLRRARDALGLDHGQFELARQLGEVRTVACGPGSWKVSAEEVARLTGVGDRPAGLRSRLRLVSSAGGARLVGTGRDRFTRLATVGCVRPVSWYVNRYRALVWLYPAEELSRFATENPGLLTGRLRGAFREALERGVGRRGRRWREWWAGQLVGEARNAWAEAAVWSALLGPEITDDAVPDGEERTHPCRLRAALPSGGPATAPPELVRRVTTATHPDEIASGLSALTEALGRARVASRTPLTRPPAPPASAAVPPGMRPRGSGSRRRRRRQRVWFRRVVGAHRRPAHRVIPGVRRVPLPPPDGRRPAVAPAVPHPPILRKRPSCITETSKCPSRSKICPRARPRAPVAMGDSCS